MGRRMLVNSGVSRCLAVRNTSFFVPLTNETFANKGPNKTQQFHNR